MRGLRFAVFVLKEYESDSSCAPPVRAINRDIVKS